jgi:carbon storage regulator
MLVIRRRVGETLLIGSDIEVEVLESGTSQVKLGIRAPRSIGVVRKEIRTVGAQNVTAAQPIPARGLAQLLKQFKNPSPKPIRPV